MTIDPKHVRNALKARELYLDNMKPAGAAADWHYAKRQARKLVAKTLRESEFLQNISLSLQNSSEHTAILRQMLAPPMSQDQFKLVCSSWSKTAENTGRGLSPEIALEVADTLIERLDPALAPWMFGGDGPRLRQIATLLRVVSTLMAIQKLATARRGRLSFEQEYAVEILLEGGGWTKLPSKLIDTRAAVPEKSFMRKTRFATDTTAHQEVDIACGLQKSYVLAMECKVTNDETNSVKRVNDVLKKAAAWKNHWGSFVITAALLQGVVAPKDVQRLTDAGVLVFWSHDLEEFKAWIEAQLS